MTEIEKALSKKDQIEAILAIGEIIWRKTEADDEFTNLTEPEKNFIYIDMLEGQVHNGGFDQYFSNYSGELAHESLKAYQEIEANKTADIIYRAIQLFPASPIPKDTDTRRKLMVELDDSISREWDKLDNEFYIYEENIALLLLDYVRRNKHKFE